MMAEEVISDTECPLSQKLTLVEQGGCLLHERAFSLELFPPLGLFSSPGRPFLP